ncbi:hypothetical protein BpJC4_02960 [Weizmannia acidilactici]|uniref:YheC/YheD family endospore coat-associated protein n=1 Tax=Weizmannia acidilactici TaxID=2607726 RepID=UPI00124C8996|nr:YheC/YheD family protein [Weizmannia acidilactici]GER65825.1 hypothetical protein BpJC4_02960 [Weizmannia acidilactici]
MTVVYFDRSKKIFARRQKTPLFWGKDKELLPFSGQLNRECSFRLVLKGEAAGPIIGILATKSQKGVISGSRDFYIRIQQKLQEKAGGLSFLFSLEDIRGETINGLFWDTGNGKWLRAIFPLPDTVYNRISSREEELAESFLQFSALLKQKGIPFFNPHFLNKYHLYETLLQQPEIAPFLPETVQVTDQNHFYCFLEQHRDVYVKPAARSQGYGIRRVIQHENGQFEYACPYSSRKFTDFAAVWWEIGKLLEKEAYLAQKTVQTVPLEGKKYDYRVHTHFNGKQYEVTGVGIRLARPGGITTHTAKGGEAAPLPPGANTSIVKEITPLIAACGTALSKAYGFFGEFTADIAPGLDGSLYLFELNAKPMEFDEPEIEEKKTEKLVDLFYMLSGYGPDD